MVMMSGFLGGVRRPVLVGALVGLVWALVAPAAGAAPPNAAKLRREADRMIAAGVPGVIVLVRDGSRTVRFARGSSRLKPHRALRVSDRFRIASLTKTYTATVVLQLAGEGKLSLKDPVERWLPGIVPNGAAITLRMLLSHQQRLFDYFNDPQTIAPYLAGDFAHVWTPEQLVAIGVAHPPLFPPNAQGVLEHRLRAARPRHPDRHRALPRRGIQPRTSGRSSCATVSPRPSSASPAHTRTGTCSPAPTRCRT